LLFTGLALVVLPAGSALAGTTVGMTGSGGFPCDTPALYTDTNYVVPPGGGTITSFSFQSAAVSFGQQLDFVVLRPAGVNIYTVVGKTGVVTLQGTGLETFRAKIRVRGGDILGLWVPDEPVVDEFLGCALPGSDVFIQSIVLSDPSVGDTIGIFQETLGPDLNESANLVPSQNGNSQGENNND
jgi:hypothetical protein